MSDHPSPLYRIRRIGSRWEVMRYVGGPHRLYVGSPDGGFETWAEAMADVEARLPRKASPRSAAGHQSRR